MKTPEEVAENFFDGVGRKQDLVGIIKTHDREVRAATLREAARFFEDPAHSPGATLTIGNAARALRDMADAIPNDVVYNNGLSFDEIRANIQSIHQQHAKIFAVAPTELPSCPTCGGGGPSKKEAP